MREISLRSRRKLKPTDARIFAHLEPDLFVDLARVVCSTGVLPQKELHECWQMACCVHKEFPDSLRVADIAAGHGLLAWILVLLARTGENPTLRTAVAVDVTRPKSADVLAAAMVDRWPDLAETVHYVEGSVDAVTSEDECGTLFVAAHACGSLSDRVLLASISSRCPVAIMPCCHSLRKQAGSLSALALAAGLASDAVDSVVASARAVGQPASINQLRIHVLTALGYEMSEASIQREVTAFNRIIMGKPARGQSQNAAPVRQVFPTASSVKRLGEIRAYEKVRSLNVSNATEAQALSKRPSREWVRSFDLSYWVEDEVIGRRLFVALDFLTARILVPQWPGDRLESDERAHFDAKAAFEFLSSGAAALPPLDDCAFARTISILDQYSDLATRRLAFTYRIELGSATVEITRADATLLRRQLCRALNFLAPMLRSHFDLRGARP